MKLHIAAWLLGQLRVASARLAHHVLLLLLAVVETWVLVLVGRGRVAGCSAGRTVTAPAAISRWLSGGVGKRRGCRRRGVNAGIHHVGMRLLLLAVVLGLGHSLVARARPTTMERVFLACDRNAWRIGACK